MPGLEDHPGCNFLPWVGPDYDDAGFDGLRLLLLGESHYTKTDAPRPTVTREVVKKYGVEGKPHQFFTKTMKTVDPASSRTAKTRREFWNSVAFYQFIQESVGEAPGPSPTPRMWKEAREPFRAAVEELRPHAILALGRRLWRHLPDGHESIVRPIDDSESMTMNVYRTSSGDRALAGHVTHPRGGLAYDVARPRSETLLTTAREELPNG